jgi:hypothetical protein
MGHEHAYKYNTPEHTITQNVGPSLAAVVHECTVMATGSDGDSFEPSPSTSDETTQSTNAAAVPHIKLRQKPGVAGVSRHWSEVCSK